MCFLCVCILLNPLWKMAPLVFEQEQHYLVLYSAVLSSTTNEHCYSGLPISSVIQYYQSAVLLRTINQQCYPVLPISSVIQDYQSAVLSSTTNEQYYTGLPIRSVIQDYQSAVLFRTTNQQCYSALPMHLPCHILVFIATKWLIASPDRCWSADMLTSADVGIKLTTSPALVYNNADRKYSPTKSCLPGIWVCRLNCKCQGIWVCCLNCKCQTPLFFSLNKNNNILVLQSPNQNKWKIKSKDGFDIRYIYAFSLY